jgi:TonB dependent receptor-like, beta-barrel/Carboxypeptidase regulatory-like domain/TonB-dependent Receptor Plug Domain
VREGGAAAGPGAGRRCGLLALALSLLAAASTFGPAAGAADAAEGWAGRPLAEALQALADGGLPLVFSTSLVRPEMRVLREPRAAAPREVAAELLAPYGLALAAAAGGRLVVVRAPAAAGEGAAGSIAAGEIAGRVVTAGEHRPVAGAEVVAGGGAPLAVSGEDGSFRLGGVVPGTYTVECRRPGYAVGQVEGVTVAAGAAAAVTCELVPAAVALDQIVVSPSRYTIYRQEPAARQFLSREEVERLPHLSDDLYRAVALLPGTAAGDISARFNVRGGEADEVLVLVDGMEIYEPFHLKDFQSLFSIVDSEAVGGLDFLAGGFGAEYGGRMSAVLDITTAEPSAPRRTTVGASFINARLLSEGTFAGDRGLWLASARRGYLDLVLDLVANGQQDFQFSPTYYDLLTKVQYRVGERTLLSGHLLAAYDDVGFESDSGHETAAARYGNGYAWVTLDSAWTSRLTSRLIVSLGRVDRSRKATSDDRADPGRESCTTCDDSFAQVRDERSFDFFGFAGDWRLRVGSRQLVKWGLAVRRLAADYDYASFASVLSPLYTGSPDPVVTRRDFTLAPSGDDDGAYLADRVRLAKRLTAELGVRWDRQTWVPGGGQVSPRVNLLYDLPGGGAVRVAWGRYAQPQGIHELQIEDGVEGFFPAQRAEQRVLGFEHPLPGGLALRVEAYDKRLSDLRPRYENLFEPIDLIPEASPDRVEIAPRRGRARGVELLLKGGGGRWSWWWSYSRAVAEDRIEDAWVPRSWDQQDAVNFSVNYRPGEKWNLNLAGVLHSGWPTTPVGAVLEPAGDGGLRIVPVLGRRNSARYPSYQRLDLRLSRRVPARRGSFQYFFEVTNLLDRANVRAVSDFDFFPQADGTVRVVRKEERWLPRIPSFGLTWEF